VTTRGERRADRRFLRRVKQDRRREVRRPHAPEYARAELVRISDADRGLAVDLFQIRSYQLETMDPSLALGNPGS
jgi:hypothetical protein